MAYRLVRESSETPNITNRDDCKMIRYAYGNYDGVVKGFREEAAITVDGSIATVHSGRIVLNGWEVDVDPNWVYFSTLPGSTQYYCIVLTVNLLDESAKFSLVSNSGAYPDVPVGDDLTQYPIGSRSIITHKIYSENGVFLSCERVVPLIPYLLDLEKRVEELGFKEGTIRLFYVDRSDSSSPIYKELKLKDSDSPRYTIGVSDSLCYFSLSVAYSDVIDPPNPDTDTPANPKFFRIELPKNCVPIIPHPLIGNYITIDTDTKLRVDQDGTPYIEYAYGGLSRGFTIQGSSWETDTQEV